METLTYKGFIGSVKFSFEDNCLIGRVLGLPNNHVILFEGNTVAELVQDFHDAIDTHISYCEANGEPLRKSYPGSFNVRVSPDIHQKMALIAIEDGISLNAIVSKAFSSYIESREKTNE